MRTSVQDQAVFAGLALVLGFALGLVFDALRAPRAKCRAVGRAALDLLYALTVFAGLFLLGLRSGAGRAGPDSVLFAVAGALLYGVTLSPMLLPVFQKAVDKLSGFVHLVTLPLRKCENKFKKIQPKVSDSTIPSTSHASSRSTLALLPLTSLGSENVKVFCYFPTQKFVKIFVSTSLVTMRP